MAFQFVSDFDELSSPWHLLSTPFTTPSNYELTTDEVNCDEMMINDVDVLESDNFLESIRYGCVGNENKFILIEEDDDDDDTNSNSMTTNSDNENSLELELVGIEVVNNLVETENYQELKLSEEEKRLLSKEGIQLPSHYPLTKFEERELKRIRRKIRNKISAQDSRKRKKEFLDKLQMRVTEVEEEKTSLSKKVRTLESANAKLAAQVKRLQMALNKQNQQQKASSSVPAATTLLVLMLSLALVVLPTRNFKSSSADVAVATATTQPKFVVEKMDSNRSHNNNYQPFDFARSRTMMNSYYGNSEQKIPRFSFHEEEEPPRKRFMEEQKTFQKKEQFYYSFDDNRIVEEILD